MIFKSILKRFWTTYTNGAMRSPKIQQKINGPIHHCFGKIKRKRNSLQNLSIKTGLISVNCVNKLKTQILNHNRFKKSSHHIQLDVSFLMTAHSNKLSARLSFCGKICSCPTSNKDVFTNWSLCMNCLSHLKLTLHQNLKIFMNWRKILIYGNNL